jgi:Holliday junction resolvase RusA-like endonuclease
MIRFTIRLLPPSLNKYRRCHWQAEGKIQDTWKEYAFVEWLRLGKPRFNAVHVTLHFLFPDRRSRDMDNYIATGSKLVGDAIKGRFIPDDDPGHLTGWSFVFGVDRLNPKTIVEIEEVSLLPSPEVNYDHAGMQEIRHVQCPPLPPG